MCILKTILFVLTSLIAMNSTTFCYSQANISATQPAEVALTLQNTTTVDLVIATVGSESKENSGGKENVVLEKLAPGSEASFRTQLGTRWIAKVGDVILAEYVANEEEQQTVDLAEVASWQLPVEIIFQNDTEDQVDVVFVSEDGQEVEYAKDLQPLKQYEQPGSPTGGLWRIKIRSEVVAEYLADNTPTQVVDLKALISDYADRVTITFQNTSTDPVDIYWLHPDGSSILYLPQMPSGTQAEQQSLSGHIWMIRQKEELIGTFVAGSDKDQEVDIVELAEQLRSVVSEPVANPAEDPRKIEPLADPAEALPKIEPKPVKNLPTRKPPKPKD